MQERVFLVSSVVHRSQGWLPRIEGDNAGDNVWDNVPSGNNVFPKIYFPFSSIIGFSPIILLRIFVCVFMGDSSL